MGRVLDFLPQEDYDRWRDEEEERKRKKALEDVESQQPTPWQQAMSQPPPPEPRRPFGPLPAGYYPQPSASYYQPPEPPPEAPEPPATEAYAMPQVSAEPTPWQSLWASQPMQGTATSRLNMAPPPPPPTPEPPLWEGDPNVPPWERPSQGPSPRLPEHTTIGDGRVYPGQEGLGQAVEWLAPRIAAGHELQRQIVPGYSGVSDVLGRLGGLGLGTAEKAGQALGEYSQRVTAPGMELLHERVLGDTGYYTEPAPDWEALARRWGERPEAFPGQKLAGEVIFDPANLLLSNTALRLGAKGVGAAAKVAREAAGRMPEARQALGGLGRTLASETGSVRIPGGGVEDITKSQLAKALTDQRFARTHLDSLRKELASALQASNPALRDTASTVQNDIAQIERRWPDLAEALPTVQPPAPSAPSTPPVQPPEARRSIEVAPSAKPQATEPGGALAPSPSRTDTQSLIQYINDNVPAAERVPSNPWWAEYQRRGLDVIGASTPSAVEAAKEAMRPSLGNFVGQTLPNRQSTKAIEQMTTPHSIAGQFQTRAKYVEDHVANGATVQTREGQRALVKPDGSYMLEKNISKTALDYAEWLGKQGAKPAVPAEATMPTAAPKPEAAIPTPSPTAAKQPWENIPSPSVLKLHHYGTVNVGGDIAYKLSSYPNGEIAKAQKAGYKEVGGGAGSYRYFTRGEPSKYQSTEAALQVATEFSLTPDPQGTRVELFSPKGKIFSQVRQTPDLEKARAALQKRGLRDRSPQSEVLADLAAKAKAVVPEPTLAPAPAVKKPLSDTAKALGFNTEDEYQAYLHAPLPETAPTPELWQETLASVLQRDRDNIVYLKAQLAKARKDAKALHQRTAATAHWQPKIDEAQALLRTDPRLHRDAVLGAQARGESVPPEVLAEYPDLAAKAKAAVVPEPTLAPTLAPEQVPPAAIEPLPAPKPATAVETPPVAAIEVVPEAAQAIPTGQAPVAPTVQGAGAPPPPTKPPKTTFAEPPPPEKPGFAGNIRLSKYPEELRPEIKAVYDANPSKFEAARRGVRSDEQVRADAEALIDSVGGKISRLQKQWEKGQAWNAEEILAQREVLANKTKAVVQAQKAAQTSDSTENLARLRLALEEHKATQEAVAGVTAEAGRALRQFRQTLSGAIESGDAKEITRILERIGGRANVEELSALLAKTDLSNPEAVYRAVRNMLRPGANDYLTELFYNWILSGPRTHMRNSIGNTFALLMSPLETITAGVVDMPLAAISGRPRQHFVREVIPEVFGLAQGLPEGVRKALYIMKNGYAWDDVAKLEIRRPQAFRGKVGAVINQPTRALAAADAMLRSMHYAANINSGAYRMARREGLAGDALANRIANLLADPPKELLERAGKMSTYRVFQQEPGPLVEKLLGAREWKLDLGVLKLTPIRFVVPFLQTPANLLKYGLERSPLGWFNPHLWRNVVRRSPEAADNIARAFLGSSIAAVVAWYATEGKITGNVPSSPSQRDAFYRSGKQPYSLKIGDKWIPYTSLEPFNQLLNQVALTLQAAQEGKAMPWEQVSALTMGVGRNLMSKEYMSGFADLLDAIEDPERYASNVSERLAVSLAVPFSGATRTTAQIMDPTIRQPEGIGEEIMATIPGLSQRVPARINVWGRQITREAPAWQPIGYATETADPVDKELSRLGVTVGFVGESIDRVDLSRDEQRFYQKLSGRLSKGLLDRIILSPEYRGLNDADKESVLKGVLQQGRNMAREAMREEIGLERREAALAGR